MPPQIDTIKSFDENENIEQSVPVDQNENIFNIQKYLLILLFLQWSIFTLTLGFGIYLILSGNTVDISSGFESLLSIITLVLYYTFGLLVTYKKYRIGLLIFASIGILLFIGVCILIGYILLVVIALGVGFGNTSRTYELIMFLGILFIVVIIIAIMSLKFSFDLAKSIKRNEYSTV